MTKHLIVGDKENVATGYQISSSLSACLSSYARLTIKEVENIWSKASSHTIMIRIWCNKPKHIWLFVT